MTEQEAVFIVAGLGGPFLLFAMFVWRSLRSEGLPSRRLLLEAVVLTQSLPVLAILYPRSSPLVQVSSLLELAAAGALAVYLLLARRARPD